MTGERTAKATSRQPRDSAVRYEIDRFLRTGTHDQKYGAWSGDFLSRARTGTNDLKQALVAEVLDRAAGRADDADTAGVAIEALARQKVEPMVRGLFHRDEQEPVIELLARSVVLVTAANIVPIIEAARWPSVPMMMRQMPPGSLDLRA